MAVGSIVDYLAGQGRDSSYSARKKLADQYGIQNYKGTAQQNTSLLGKLRNGSSGSSGGVQTATAPTVPEGVAAGQNVQVGVAPGAAAGAVAGASGSASGSSSRTTTPVTRNYQRSERVNQLYQNAMGAANNIPDDYDPSDDVLGYRQKVKDTEAEKPDAWKSRYDAQINEVLGQILNEDPFSYTGKDMMGDDMYKMYSDMYQRNARLAMENAMGDAQAMTGGYGSTYSQAAGQQAYDGTMANMNQIAMDLADRAYQRYQDTRTNRYNQIGTLTGLDDRDYGHYRDEIGDWKDMLNYYAGRYDSEYAKDYGQYRDQVADAQNVRDYWMGAYDAERDNDFSEYSSDLQQDQWERQWAQQQEEWALDKQLKELQLAKAQQAAAGGSGGSGGGGGRRSSSGSSYPTTNSTGGIDWEDALGLSYKARQSGKKKDKNNAANAFDMLSDEDKRLYLAANLSRGR